MGALETFEIAVLVVGGILIPLSGYAVNYLNAELRNLHEGHCEQEVRIAVLEAKLEMNKKCKCKDEKGPYRK